MMLSAPDLQLQQGLRGLRVRPVNFMSTVIVGISPMPILVDYSLPPDSGARLMRAVNASIVDEVGAGQGRIVGLGTVPLQDVGAAVRELDWLMSSGLAGVEIGPRIGGLELDDLSRRSQPSTTPSKGCGSTAWFSKLTTSGLLVNRFGADSVMMGTDHPFIEGELDRAPTTIETASRRWQAPADVRSRLLSGNAHDLFGRSW